MIQRLPARVSEQLCASQVIVDMPSSIKELIENSLDAGARSIRVTLEEHGKLSIEVMDDGTGISQQDLASITLKGATSKLPEFDQLTEVSTLGFRGEALNALRNLASLQIETRTKADASASVVSLQEGVVLHKKEVNYPHGTKITLRNLFKGVPVRERYWHDHCKQSSLRVVQLLKQYSLSYLDVQFVLTNSTDGRTHILFQVGRAERQSLTDKKAAWLSRIQAVLGTNVASNIEYFETAQYEGWISHQQLGRINTDKLLKRNILFMYVNGRPVDFLQSLYRGIEELLRQWNSFGKFLCILKITTQAVDITSTPDKRYLFMKEQRKLVDAVLKSINALMEGWYHRPREIEHALLFQSQAKVQDTRKSQMAVPVEKAPSEPQNRRVSEGVKSRFSSMIQSTKPKTQKRSELPPQKPEPTDRASTVKVVTSKIAECPEAESPAIIESLQPELELAGDMNPPPNFTKADFLRLSIVGQFNIGFIVCELERQLYLVDQHAASEKTNYEMLMNQPPGKIQRSKIIALSPLDAAHLEQEKEALERFGYEFQAHPDKVHFQSFPIYAGQIFDEKNFLELCRNGKVPRPENHRTIMNRTALKACHMSITVGETLNRTQMQNLLDSMAQLASPWNCPHGRPTIVRLTDMGKFTRAGQALYRL